MQRHLARSALRALSRRPPSATRSFCAPATAQAVGVPPAPSEHDAASTSPRVAALLDDLVSLNMLEVKELTEGLKNRLGIDDVPAMPAGFNPTMFAGAMPGGAAAPAEEEKKPEKTHFDLKLNKFDAGKKIAVIKEVRSITGLGLKEAKTLVEDAPKVFKTEVSKDEAEQLRDKLKELGADVSLE